jgi:hypothetical protein
MEDVMRDVKQLLGKFVQITNSTNPFGQHWIGQTGIVTGELAGGLGIAVDVGGTEVWVFWGNFKLLG